MKNNDIEERIDYLEERISLLDSLRYYKHNYYLLEDNDSEVKRYIIIEHIFKLDKDILEAEIIQLGYKDKYKAYSIALEPTYAQININAIRNISKKQFQDFVYEFRNSLNELINSKVYNFNPIEI